MAYYIRIFCKSPTPSSLRNVRGWIHESGGTILTSPEEQPVDLDSNDWNQIAFCYRDAARLVDVDLDRDTGTDDCLFRQEVGEFVDQSLASVQESRQKRKVIAHLRSSKYVVAIRVPTGHFEDR